MHAAMFFNNNVCSAAQAAIQNIYQAAL